MLLNAHLHFQNFHLLCYLINHSFWHQIPYNYSIWISLHSSSVPLPAQVLGSHFQNAYLRFCLYLYLYTPFPSSHGLLLHLLPRPYFHSYQLSVVFDVSSYPKISLYPHSKMQLEWKTLRSFSHSAKAKGNLIRMVCYALLISDLIYPTTIIIFLILIKCQMSSLDYKPFGQTQPFPPCYTERQHLDQSLR